MYLVLARADDDSLQRPANGTLATTRAGIEAEAVRTDDLTADQGLILSATDDPTESAFHKAGRFAALTGIEYRLPMGAGVGGIGPRP